MMRPGFRLLLEYTAYVVVFFAVVRAGIALFSISSTSFAVLWPMSGLALAAVLLRGYGMLLPIFLGELLAAVFEPHIGVAAAAAFSFGQAIQAGLGAWALRRAGFEPELRKLRNALLFVIGSLCIPAVAPLVSRITLALLFGAGSATPGLSFARSWTGGIFSLLIVTPLVLMWWDRPHAWRTVRFESPRYPLERAAAFTLLLLCDYVIFWTELPQSLGVAVIFVIPAVLIWFALRFYPRWTALAIFLTADFGLLGSFVLHMGDGQLVEHLFADESYIGFIAAIYYIFAAIVDERRAMLFNAQKNNAMLRNAMERLADDDRSKNEFLAVLAHELRNPLSPVVSSLELLELKAKEENGSPEVLELLATARLHSHTITQLLEDLLDVSRITQKKFSLKKEPTELQSVVNRALATVSEAARARDHRLEISLPPEPLWIETDPVRLQQMMTNLLSNAVKYTDPGGDIRLQAVHNERKGGVLRISVRDTGIGIEPDNLERIFEPFMQKSSDASGARGSGLGIGLYLTRQLAKLHGGTVWATSGGLGKGSEFIMELKAKKVSARAHPEHGRDVRVAQRLPAHAHAVLVVDDNESAAKGLVTLLTRSGHAATSAADGKGALEAMSRDKADTVLLDIGLPDMDGYAVARELRKAYGEGLTLIALTGYGQEEDRRKARVAGFDYHLTKPVSINDIKELLALSEA